MAKDSLELVDKLLGWKHFHLVGLSMGGMISLEMSLMILDRLLSLTLLSTHAGRTIAPLDGLLHIMTNFRPSLPPEKHADFLIPLLYSNQWLQSQFIDENGTQWPNITNFDMVRQELNKARMEVLTQDRHFSSLEKSFGSARTVYGFGWARSSNHWTSYQ